MKRLPTRQDRGICPESYSPCTCESTDNGLEVTCLDVPIETIQSVFYSTRDTVIFSVELSFTGALEATRIELPADLLSDKRVKNIYLRCPLLADPKVQLVVNTNAFYYSRASAVRFQIENCGLANLPSFAFLQNFDALNDLRVTYCNDVNLASLPQLPALEKLLLAVSTGLQENAETFPSLTPAQLSHLSLSVCGLDDAGARVILDKIASSTSASSLAQLFMTDNNLTVVPAQLHAFPRLNRLYLSENDISLTKTGDLSFEYPVSAIYLDGNGITEMAPGTFESGDFSHAEIHLEHNELSVLDKNVFLNVLQQMSDNPPTASGFVDVLNSKHCVSHVMSE